MLQQASSSALVEFFKAHSSDEWYMFTFNFEGIAGEAGAMKEEAYLEEFFTEIMEAEEFGEADSKRMVAMRGTGWIDYIREFHHQMQLLSLNSIPLPPHLLTAHQN